MRIVMTTDVIGGVWTFTQELSSGLLEDGCDVVLVSLGGLPTPVQQRWVSEMVEHWNGRFFFKALQTNLEWMQANEDAFDGAAEILSDLADEVEADVFHLNQFCFGALRTALPKVVTAHSDVLTWAKYCRAGVMEETSWLQRYRVLVTEGLAHADTVIAPTQWMMEEAGSIYNLPIRQQVIPNGRRVKAASAVHRELQAVTAGRVWDEAKHISILGETASPMPLLVAGDVSGEHGSPSPVGATVRLLGVLDESELLRLFHQSAIYICASVYEPFGLAPLEAALCGCAVLANDIPSLHEVWGEGALYFDDARSLSSLLHHLATDRDALQAAQARSGQRATIYTRERMTASYLAVFADVVSRAGAEVISHVA